MLGKVMYFDVPFLKDKKIISIAQIFMVFTACRVNPGYILGRIVS